MKTYQVISSNGNTITLKLNDFNGLMGPFLQDDNLSSFSGSLSPKIVGAASFSPLDVNNLTNIESPIATSQGISMLQNLATFSEKNFLVSPSNGLQSLLRANAQTSTIVNVDYKGFTRQGQNLLIGPPEQLPGPIGPVLKRPQPSVPKQINPNAPAVLQTIEGINFDENASNTGFYQIPPDPIGAAGPNHVVSVVNSSIEWHTKAGVQQNSQSLQSFFASVSPATLTFDPKVIYDQYAGRFVVATLEQTGRGTGSPADDVSKIFLAVSDDSDPNGTWYRFAIDSKVNIGGVNNWADYPGFAIDEEAIYITNNMFKFEGTGDFSGSRLWIVPKSPFYSGGAATSSIYDPSTAAGLPGQAFTLQPAHTLGSAPAGLGTFLVNTGWQDGSGNDFLSVIQVNNPVGAPTFSNQFVPLGNIYNPAVALPEAPQQGTSTKIATNDPRALNAVWRNNALWTVNTINPLSGSDAGQATAHWYKIDTTNLASLSLADQGNIGGEDIAAGTHTFFPSIAVNGTGDVGIGFAASAPTIFPGAYYTGRTASDPVGTVQPSGVLAAGQDFYIRTFGGPRNRWGDYSGISVDPSNDSTFWVFNEYALPRGTASGGEDGRWGTRWGSFKFGDSPPPLANDNFANAITLTGSTANTTGSNVGATGEVGEPAQSGEINSVWWSWTAPETGRVTIDTNGSGFDTYLSAFTGSAVNNLTVIQQDDDGGDGVNSRVSFLAEEGVEYQIAVDGYSSDTGDFSLNFDWQSYFGAIEGAIWNDVNGNGTWDNGENPLPNWQVYLDQNRNGQFDTGEITTVTDANGDYLFEDLTPGVYVVAEVIPSGWRQTYPDQFNPNSIVSSPSVNSNPPIDTSTITKPPSPNLNADYQSGELIIKLKDRISTAEINTLKTDLGARVLNSVSNLDIELWSIENMSVAEAISLYGGSKLVEYMEPNYTITIESISSQATPNDPSYSQLWGLHNTGQTGGTADADIDAPEAWDITTGSSNVIVGVIDTGIDYTHPDLVNNMWINTGEIPGNGIDDDGNGYIDDVHGYDFAYDDGNPMDVDGHGTHVAGTIGGQGNNGVGVAGVNWNVKLMALKFLASSARSPTLYFSIKKHPQNQCGMNCRLGF
jgi:hypothetical protein